MADLHSQRTGYQLMMRCLIGHFPAVFAFLEPDTGSHKRKSQEHVDLIDRQPVLHFVTEALEEDRRIADEVIDHFSALPASDRFDEMHGSVKVNDGYERLDTVFEAFVKHTVIECKTLLIGFRIISIRENACPVNAHTEALKAHLCHQRYIFFIMVIEIYTEMSGIVMIRIRLRYNHVAPDDRESVLAVRNHVIGAEAFAAFHPSAFTLIGSGRAAPQKIL